MRSLVRALKASVALSLPRPLSPVTSRSEQRACGAPGRMERFDNSLEYESLPDTQEATQERLSLEPLLPEEEEEKPKPWGRLVSLNPNVDHFLLYDKVTTIGRAKSCSLTLTDSFISAKHCRIEHEDDETAEGQSALAFLYDTSSNGSFLNGEKVGLS